MSKDITLKQAADKLFANTKHTVLFGVDSCKEFFTTENMAKNACQKDESPVRFTKQSTAVTDQSANQYKEKLATIRSAKSLQELDAFKDDKNKGILKELEKKKEELTKQQ